VLASAAALLLMAVALAGAFAALTRTSFGREWVRGQIVEFAKRVNGRVYVGRLSGGLFGGFTVDSVEIRGPDDSLFIATGRVHATYDVRDLFDQRVLIKSVEVEHPVVRLAKGSDEVWNWRRIFPKGAPKPPRRGPGFGDFIVIDSATVRDGSFILTMPWRPADSLSGARRDSAIAFNLARGDHEVRRVAGGYAQTYRWTRADYASGYVRIADPDSVGRFFDIAALSVEETVPPFSFRNVRGGVRQLGDSAWLAISHWDTPGSTGTGRGKVVWGSDLPIRYAVDVTADSVSLKDVAWVYPTLPTTGGGKLRLSIRNDPRDLNVLNYALREIDVRTMRSRLRGAMTFGVGGEVLTVTNVSMRADPIDFGLIRQLNGKDFPYPWAGQITGWVRARGGRLDRFEVDSSHVVFRDANVAGATHEAYGSGGLNILFPAFTRFRAFRVSVEHSDLATFRYLNPEFPPLGGYVRGSALLDSLWYDVRFRNARVAHVDGPAAPSEFAGGGRVTVGETFLVYDLDVTAEPLSFTTLARSYPMLPLRGVVRGPLRVQGTSDSLEVAATLAGAAGAVEVNGHVDVFEPSYAARLTGTFRDLDARALLADSAVPPMRLDGAFAGDVRGSSLATLAGPASLTLDRSQLAGVTLFGAAARVAFDAGRVRVDTAAVAAAGVRASAAGALALEAGRRDTLGWSLEVDSLGALRPLLAAAGTAAPPDTLAGTLRLAGTVRGSTADTLAASATVDAGALAFGGTRARRLRGRTELANVVGGGGGGATLIADSLDAGGVMLLRQARLDASFPDPERGRVTLAATSENGAAIEAGSAVRIDSLGSSGVIDRLALQVPDNRWTLEQSARWRVGEDGVWLDTLLVRGSRAGWLLAHGAAPRADSVSVTFAADSLPLADVSAVAGMTTPLGGSAALNWRVAGSRDEPVMRFDARLDSLQVGAVRLERVVADGRYADLRMDATVRLFEDGRPAFTAAASLPLDLALVPVEQRRLDGSPLSVAVRSDSVNLTILEALSRDVQRASGRFQASVDVGGVWSRPRLSGSAVVRDGALSLVSTGVRYSRATADVRLAGDSLRIVRVGVTTGGERAGTADVTGLVSVADAANPAFDLTATMRDFNVVDRTSVGDIHVSTAEGAPMRLTGAVSGSRLTGGVVVSRADIAIPELAQKDVVSLDDPEFFKLVDTTLSTNRTLLPKAPPAVVRNLTVDDVNVVMGPDVWLRSTEANINLGGALRVTTARGAADAAPALALGGTLATERGTYRLNVGVALQRTFEVERGTLRFFESDVDINPALDVSAIHTVRQVSSGRRDVRVRARIGGTLAQPTLTLESADPTLQLSQSELISYLVTGAPSFDVAGQGGTVGSLLLPSLGGLITSSLGGVADVIQIETVNSLDRQSGGSLGRTTGSLLGGTRLAAGWQIGDRQFLSANLGLCQLGNALSGNGGFSADGLQQSIGLKYEYRFPRALTLSAGLEPSTTAFLCSTSGATTVRNFVPTPRQFGFDLLRRWEF
jgi:translocation and assembly module TamB